ncbi:restriction endonuclease subunit S [Rhodococcus sp. BGS-1C]|uniref:restriction endonuclease subunit S n=2 Tax=Rhodococcus TaxID=1827 RepID=UPI003D16178A
MNWPTYADYRRSGVGYLGSVPVHWTVSRFSRHIRINGGQVDPRIEPFRSMPLIAPNHIEPETGKLTALESAEDQGADSGKYLVTQGQLIYSKIRPNLAKAITAPTDCLCSADMYGLSPNPTVLESDFALRVLLSRPFTDYAIDSSMRVAMPKVNHESLGAAPIWFPPLEEQRKIVDFIDRETDKIDALIAKQMQLITTLREDRAATITQAVTKGLDPNIEMKDSRAPWVGDVPAHWSVAKIKHGFSVTLGKMYQGEVQGADDLQLPHLKAGSLTAAGLNLDDPMLCWFAPAEVSSLTLRKGDILVVEGGAIGRCVVLDRDLPNWGFQKSLNRVRALYGDSPRFLAYLIEAATLSGHVSILCGKATISHFTAEKVEALEWPHPSVDEQAAIVAFLDARCAQVDDLIWKSTEMIDTLREYRSALITDAVTGRINVQGVG